MAAGLVFALWYPYPYREISGGRELFLIVVAVDVIMGPLLTLAVFNRSKPVNDDTRMRVEEAVAALGYRTNTAGRSLAKAQSRLLMVLVPVLGGGLLLAMRDGLWAFDPARGERVALASPPYDPAQERFNDGKCDPQGRFWVGTIYEPRDPPLAALYCWDRGQLSRRADGITVSNGLGWSPDNRRMYFTDSVRRTIYVYDFDLFPGTISNRRPFIILDASDGTPDGLTVDAEGCLWVAVWDAWHVARFSPRGQELQRIRLQVTAG